MSSELTWLGASELARRIRAGDISALKHGSGYHLFPAASYSVLHNLLGMQAGVVPVTRVRQGEECDRPRQRDVILRTAKDVEEGSAGLPVGVQVVGRHWREDVVLALMAVLDDSLRNRPDYPSRPPVDGISH